MSSRMFPDKEVLFTSLGMTILDENQYPPSWNRPNEYDILGGAGPYAIIGGRIVAGKEKGGLISGIIDEGEDFPGELERLINSWETGIMVRLDMNRKTTRGVNIYNEEEHRDFEYLTEKRQLMAYDMINYGLGPSDSFHLICSMDRAKRIINNLDKYAEEIGRERPKYIYEPLPSSCIYSNLKKVIKILPNIDVFSPNLEEAASLVKQLIPKTEEGIRKLAGIFSPYIRDDAAIVIRCGELGCYVKTSNLDILFPAYYQNQTMVNDVTGAGNGFCGGFMTGYLLSGCDWVAGAICGTLTSGCIIEKLGIPIKTESDGKELWNGLSFEDRLKTYISHNSELFKDLDRNVFNWNQQFPINT